MTGSLFFLLLIIAGFLLYFLPTLIAFHREHPNRWIIVAINTFLGATGIVWLIALIWSLRAVHLSPDGSDGGESGLNGFVNDQATVRVIHENTPSPERYDVTAQLVRLKGLLDSGGITTSEYEQLKQKAIQGG